MPRKSFHVALALVLACCGGAPALLAAQARLVVRPLVIPAGDTTDHVDLVWHGTAANASKVIVAVAYDATGRLLTNQAVRWTSSDTTIARVVTAATMPGASADGVVVAGGFGSATLTATIQGLSSSLLACVYGPGAPGGVSVTGPAWVLVQSRGAPVQFIASTATGVPYPAPCVHWSVGDSTIASVTRRGVATGRKASYPASITVRATLGVP